MAEPTSGLSFVGLIRRVANKAGVAYFGVEGDQSACVPVDNYNLGVCKDIVRDAFRMFVSDAPKNGWRWQKRLMSVTLTATRITGTADSASATTIVDLTLKDTYDTNDDLKGYYCYITGETGVGSWAVVTGYTAISGTITVADWLDQYGNAGGTDPATGGGATFAVTPVETVGGDIARYPLPEYFGGEVAGNINYAKDTSHATPIEWRDESLIRANRSVSVSTGYPYYAAIRSLEPAITSIEDGSSKRRFELILDPQPSAADTLQFPYLLHFDNLDLETGTADSGGDTTLVDALRLEADDYFVGWRCDVISDTGKGSWAIVTDFANTDGTITVGGWLKPDGTADGTNPGANSAYTLQPVNNFHPAGFVFDEPILAACYAKLSIEDEDVEPGLEERYLKKALPKAYQADARLAPKTLGSMNGSEGSLERIWTNITTEHDV